jgi:hypothetical protein
MRYTRLLWKRRTAGGVSERSVPAVSGPCRKLTIWLCYVAA